jgi:gluconolactonase
MKSNQLVLTAWLFVLFSCTVMKESTKTIGSVEQIDASLESIVDKDAKVEVLAEGYKWSEGPVWIPSQKMLLFSDVPNNIIHKWTEEKGVEVFLTPSGYTGTAPSQSREPGSNGLTIDNTEKLILCQHGDRRIARLDSPFDKPSPKFTTVADRFDGKRFNSPNDVVVRSNGDIFFTDPPYGLPQQENDPSKELQHHGVYKISADGKVTLIVDSLTRPNGIAFLPGEKTLIVANSDPEKAAWYAFDLDENDSVTNARIFYDATSMVNDENKGLPDGLRVSKKGNVFATGPGGIWIFDRNAKVLGKIRISEPTANCAFDEDEKTLYTTSNMYLCRIKLK